MTREEEINNAKNAFDERIIEEGTDLFKLKEEYDKNPLHSLRRVKHNNN